MRHGNHDGKVKFLVKQQGTFLTHLFLLVIARGFTGNNALSPQGRYRMQTQVLVGRETTGLTETRRRLKYIYMPVFN
jgi:hypothetical protein